MKTLLLLVSMLMGFHAFSQAPPWQWVNIGGGQGTSTGYSEQTTDMVVDGEGNVYVTGEVSYFAHFDTNYIQGFGGSDLFLAKYDCGGNLAWVQTAGSNSVNEDLAFVALDDSGNVYWSGEMESTGSYNFHIGDTVFAGELNTFFIAKIDPATGDIAWVRPQGVGNVLILFYGFAVKDGYIYANARNPLSGELVAGVSLIGQYLARFDLDGNFVDVNNYAPNSSRIAGRRLSVDGNGNIFMVGDVGLPVVIGNDTIQSSASPSPNGLLLKFDPNLDLLWYKLFESGTFLSFSDLAIDSANEVYITGIFTDTLDYGNGFLVKIGSGGSVPFLLKLDNDGNGIWARSSVYQTTGFNSYDVTLDNRGNAYISGHYFGAIAFGPDTVRTYGSMEPFYASYDSAGNYRFAGSVACLGNARNVGWNIAVDGNQNIFLAGSFSSGIVFQGDTIDRAYGDTDLFLAKFGQPSCVPPCPVPVAGFSVTPSGLSVSFSNSSTDADSVRYVADGNPVAGNSYQFPAPGTYAVCQYVYSNCGGDTLCQQVTVACAPPVAGFGTEATGLAVSFTDSALLADSVWYIADGSVISGTFHTFDTPGTYAVCQYASSVCGTDSLCRQVTVMDVGIGQTSLIHRLYPNPTQGLVTVELPAGNYSLELYGLLGENVGETSFQGRTTIDISHLSQGIYVYRISSADGKTATGKLVVR